VAVLAYVRFASTRKAQVRTVAFVVTTLSNPFFVDMTDGAREEAKKHPEIRLVIQAPERGATDIERQTQIVENLVTQKVDAICIVPADSRSILPAIAQANRSLISVLNVDNRIDVDLAKADNIHIATYIGSDNYLGGKLAAEYIVKQLNGRGKLAVLEGVSGVDAAIKRKAGFMDYVKDYPGITVVASQPADWDREKGLNVFQSVLEAHPDLDALFASNDEMALGAIQAIKAARKEGKMIVVGFDATKDGLEAVKAGTMNGTVAQQPALMGQTCVLKASELISGKSIEPYIGTEVKLITR
jgi:ribose transport system substrate-binding protein